jgi:hypothetical protein
MGSTLSREAGVPGDAPTGAARRLSARRPAPWAGTLHHVILRGMELGQIVTDRADSAMVRAQRLRQAQARLRLRSRWDQGGLQEFRMGSRRRRIAAVRAHLAVVLVTRLGISTSEIAKAAARADRR